MKRARYLAPIVGLGLFFSAWEALVRMFDVRPFILRSPSRIIRYLASFADDYAKASWVTVQHAVLGLLIALGFALVIGAAMAASTFVEQATQPVLTLVAVTPFVAYIASVVLWLGSGTRPAVFIVGLVTLPGFAFAAADGMRSADPSSRELFASIDASPWDVFWRLRLPSAGPALFTVARYNIGLALIAAYLVEGGNFANQGLGAIGKRAGAQNEGDPLWAAIFSMAILGSLGLVLLNVLQQATMGWHASQRSQRR
jgi:NitT/TauT family transport system permease protein